MAEILREYLQDQLALSDSFLITHSDVSNTNTSKSRHRKSQTTVTSVEEVKTPMTPLAPFSKRRSLRLSDVTTTAMAVVKLSSSLNRCDERKGSGGICTSTSVASPDQLKYKFILKARRGGSLFYVEETTNTTETTTASAAEAVPDANSSYGSSDSTKSSYSEDVNKDVISKVLSHTLSEVSSVGSPPSISSARAPMLIDRNKSQLVSFSNLFLRNEKLWRNSRKHRRPAKPLSSHKISIKVPSVSSTSKASSAQIPLYNFFSKFLWAQSISEELEEPDNIKDKKFKTDSSDPIDFIHPVVRTELIDVSAIPYSIPETIETTSQPFTLQHPDSIDTPIKLQPNFRSTHRQLERTGSYKIVPVESDLPAAAAAVAPMRMSRRDSVDHSSYCNANDETKLKNTTFMSSTQDNSMTNIDVKKTKVTLSLNAPRTSSSSINKSQGAATPLQVVDNNVLKLHPALAEIVAMSSSPMTALSKVMKQYVVMHPYDDLAGASVNKRLMIPHDLCISFDETEVTEYTGCATSTAGGGVEPSTPRDAAKFSGSSPAVSKTAKLLAHWTMFHKNHLRYLML